MSSPQPAPMSEAVTNSIRVEVMSQYSPENSRPNQDVWVFEYTVRITNQGTETVQLLTRHWIITDGLDHVEEVKGPGVIGEQPTEEWRGVRDMSVGIGKGDGAIFATDGK